MSEQVHILRTDVGVIVTARIDVPSRKFLFEWIPAPPYTRKKFKRIARQYIPWRDRIMEAEAQRLKICFAMFTPGVDGVPLTVVYGKEFSKGKCNQMAD